MGRIAKMRRSALSPQVVPVAERFGGPVRSRMCGSLGIRNFKTDFKYLARVAGGLAIGDP